VAPISGTCRDLHSRLHGINWSRRCRVTLLHEQVHAADCGGYDSSG
jgi:hypothetical protein